MNSRSARIEIHQTFGNSVIVAIRDYCGPDYLTMGQDYAPGSRPWSTCKPITPASYSRLLAIVNACGPVVETTDGYDFQIVAEWPPERK